MALVWEALFADVPAAVLDISLGFWSALTGGAVGTPEGNDGEIIPMHPADGDPHLWVQRTGRAPGEAGWHPDLFVDDLPAAVEKARRLGAAVVRSVDQLVVLDSPAGQPFCLVTGRAGKRRSTPVRWPAGHRSMLDQLCIDIPVGVYERESGFWTELTGWERDRTAFDEFERLRRPDGQVLRILLQRVDKPDDAIACHVDLSSDDVAAEVARHQRLGAEPIRRFPHWMVMRAPDGLVYCITDREPGR